MSNQSEPMYLWRPPAGQDEGIGKVLSQAFSDHLDAEMDDATARVWWSRLQEEMEADAEMQGRKLVVYRATPSMILSQCDSWITRDLLSTYLEGIQQILDSRDAA